MKQTFFLVRSRPGDPEFLKVLLTAFYEILKQHGVGFEFASTNKPKEQAQQWVYNDMQQRGSVILVDDHEMPPTDMPVRYVVFGGEAEFVERVTPWLESLLPVIPLPELQEAARTSMSEEPQLLVLMAMATGDAPVPASLDIVLEAMRHEDELARFTAVFTASVVPWEALKPEVRRLEREDPSERVRILAHNVLSMCP